MRKLAADVTVDTSSTADNSSFCSHEVTQVFRNPTEVFLEDIPNEDCGDVPLVMLPPTPDYEFSTEESGSDAPITSTHQSGGKTPAQHNHRPRPPPRRYQSGPIVTVENLPPPPKGATHVTGPSLKNDTKSPTALTHRHGSMVPTQANRGSSHRLHHGHTRQSRLLSELELIQRQYGLTPAHDGTTQQLGQYQVGQLTQATQSDLLQELYGIMTDFQKASEPHHQDTAHPQDRGGAIYHDEVPSTPLTLEKVASFLELNKTISTFASTPTPTPSSPTLSTTPCPTCISQAESHLQNRQRQPLSGPTASAGAGMALESPLGASASVSVTSFLGAGLSSTSIPGAGCSVNSVASMRDALPTFESKLLQQAVDDEGNDTINEYTILGELGRGSFATVDLAEHSKTKQLYAVKAIRRSLLRRLSRNGPDRLQRVMAEIAIMKKLRHHNVVQLHEVIDDPTADKLFLVLQYVQNGPVLKLGCDGTCKPLSLPVAAKYLRQLVTGLQYLHRHNIMHRDIKPDNILLGKDGTVYLSDFGVSSCFDDTESMSRTEGTPAFFSPEVCRGEGHLHQRESDVWALGVTFFCMIIGRLPFTHQSTFSGTVDAIQNETVQYPPSNETDPQLMDLLHGMLNKDPLRRITLPELKNHPWLVKHAGCGGRSRHIPALTVCDCEVASAFSAVEGIRMLRRTTLPPAAEETRNPRNQEEVEM